jgi:hypothetical protein
LVIAMIPSVAWKTATRNVLLVLALAYPIWFAVTWLGIGLEDGPQAQWYAAFAYYLLVLAVPLVVGSMAHQMVLAAIPSEWTRVQRRSFAIGTSCIVLVALWALGTPAAILFSHGFFLPMCAGLIVYGIGIRLPVRSSSR